MATALYRRYRPETFAEVIGQGHVTDPLRTALREGRVGQAYLFSGPRGCGKTTSARILARCLNCAQGPTDTPCGVCDSCVELARGGSGSLDVAEIDAASHGGVDDARELRERATFSTVRDRFKVFIVDEAHMVSPQGFNALLKIVEEPPPHVVFLFATTEPEKVLPTIRSRTHHYPFRLVPPETLQGYLEEVCASEGVAVGAGVLPLVVRAGAGSVRDSLSVLDQLSTGSQDGAISQEQALALLGYTPQSLLDDAVSALAVGDGAAAFRVVDRVVGSGQDPRRFVDDLLQRLRDLIIVEAVGRAAADVFPGCPADQLERMAQQAGAYGAAALSRAADLANSASSEMTGATSPRLHLELLVARLLLPAADDGQRGLAARLERVERRLSVPVPASAQTSPAAPAPIQPPASVPVPVSAPVPVPVASPAAAPVAPEPAVASAPEVRDDPPAPAAPASPAPSAPSGEPEPREPERAAEAPPSAPEPSSVAEVDGTCQAVVAATGSSATAPGTIGGSTVETTEAVRRQWPDVLHHLTTTSRRTWTRVAHDAAVLEVDADRLVLQFKTPGPLAAFSQGPHAENVRAALSAVLGMDRAVLAVAEGAATARGGAPAPAPQAAGGSADAPRPSHEQGRSAEPSDAPAPASAPHPEPAGQASGPPTPASAPPTLASAPASADPSVSPPAPAASPAARTAGAPVADAPAVGGPDAPPEEPAPSGGRRQAPAGGDPDRAGGATAGHRGDVTTSKGYVPGWDDAPPPTDDDEPVPDDGAPPEAGTRRPRTPTPGSGPAPGPASPSGSAPSTPPSGAAAARASLRAVPEPAAVPDGEDDEPSRDDADAEDSGLVGAALVAARLGGRVVEA